RAHVLGASKPVSYGSAPLGAGLDPHSLEHDLFERPEQFLAGPQRSVPADPDRRIVGRREFVAAHLEAPGAPHGHGFTAANLAAGTAYGTYDAPSRGGPSHGGGPLLRVILLDTANLDGSSTGSLGVRQFAWLEEQLIACHSCYGGEDRLVVLASHHGLKTLSNLRQLRGGLEEDQPRVGAAEVAALLSRFGNVVCWLNGHRHENEIVARAGSGGGFWEISTASIADWPSEGRLVELVDNQDGTLSLLTTMVDHLGPPDPRDAEGLDRLASLHRELAANVPGAGFGSLFEGTPADRNCELVLPAPFPVA
ncbi:MAG: hypothetical protein ACRDZ5_11650, partial [Acidimicrobiales bacterium]